MRRTLTKADEDYRKVRDALDTAMDALLPDPVLGPYFAEAKAALERRRRVALKFDTPNP